MDVVAASWAGTEFVHVPPGGFVMGSTAGDPLAWGYEHPRHTVVLDYGYWIGRTPATNEQFAGFVEATGHVTRAEEEGWAFVFDPATERWERTPGASWRHPTGPAGDAGRLSDHPVVSVSWHDARAYCEWFDECCGADLPDGLGVRLPGEAGWEKAARGPDGPVYPWGDRFEPAYCNHIESPARATVPAATLPPASESVYGAAAMSGNTWDWTTTLWGAVRDEAQFSYPYDPADGREDLAASDDVFRIIRGGSFKNEPQACRSACRDLDPPGWSLNNLGFRPVLAPPR